MAYLLDLRPLNLDTTKARLNLEANEDLLFTQN